MSDDKEAKKKMYFIGNWRDGSIMPVSVSSVIGIHDDIKLDIEDRNKADPIDHWGFMTSGMFEFYPLGDLIPIMKLIAKAEKEGITEFNGAKAHIIYNIEKTLKNYKEHRLFSEIIL